MRVWFLKETKSICTSCGTGCNIVMGSREGIVHRYEPRENNAVNSSWMCDYGRLNYKWINRADRLSEVRLKDNDGGQVVGSWATAVREISQRLSSAARGSLAIIASARQTNEELYLLKKIADKVGAITDSIPRRGEGDKLLLNPDRNPNTIGSQLIGIGAKELGKNIPSIGEGIRKGTIKTLVVFGEDVTKHGIGNDLLAKLELLVVSDILPSATVEAAHVVLPGVPHAEKRGTFTNIKGRVQRFMKAIEPPGNARAEWEFLHEIVLNVTGQNGFVSIEGLFNQMAKEVPAFDGLTWGGLGDLGASVPI
jgi:NADH-quinone oxidoreductase subunit G